MLEISFEDLALTVLALSFLLLTILLASWNSRYRQKRRQAVRKIMTCEICGHLYHDESSEKIVDCPQCGRANLRGRDKSLG